MSWRNRGCRKISDVDGCSIVKFPWWAKIRMIKRHILPIGANTVLNLLFGKGCWKDIQDWLLLKSRAWNTKGLRPPHILQKHPQGVPTNSGLSCPGKATPTMHKVAQNGQPTFFTTKDCNEEQPWPVWAGNSECRHQRMICVYIFYTCLSIFVQHYLFVNFNL